ncbi:MAG: hypothetical protein LLF86_02150 [Nitrospiraceae bacterium]|nr:hypothetical protein [Nitrospiraceae bacterium]
MKQNHIIKIAIVITATLLIIPSVVYFFSFHSNGISKDPANWGVFGDYLNPFVALANLVVLVFLAYLASQFEDKRNKKTLDLQKKIQFNEIRYNAYKDILEALYTFDGALKHYTYEKHESLELIISRAKIERAFKASTYFFIDFKHPDTTNELLVLSLEIYNLFNSYFKENNEPQKKQLFEQILNKINTFSTIRNQYIDLLQLHIAIKLESDN